MVPEPPAVEVIDVSKSYEEAGETHLILDTVSLAVRSGEVVALLGRSGSGKTTLLNLVAGIDMPLAGRILVAGQDITAMGDRDRTLFRRANIGFVFQFFNLIPTLTVRENVQLPVELSARSGWSGRLADEMLLAVGLLDRAGTFPDRLSGGEQQRVAIARALVSAPAVVLADEPTGNLDADTGATVLDMLFRLARGAGGSMLVATHSRSVAARADRALRVLDGRLEPHSVDIGVAGT